MESVVRQLDHIFASVKDPKVPFEAFLKLGFPLAWPVAQTPEFASGGFFLDNLKIEFTHFDGDVFSPEGSELKFTGLAFEPEPLAQTVATLDERQVPRTKPVTIGNFTNCFITDVSPSYYVFLCEYDLATHPWVDPVPGRTMDSPKRTVADRWRYYRGLLEDGVGGALGAQSARELMIGTPDPVAAVERWSRLLGPPNDEENAAWRLGPGPSIRLVENQSDEILALEISVRSLPDAIIHLREVGALAETDSHSAYISSTATFGLPIKLTPG